MKTFGGQRGQVIVEYVLLLVVVVSLATLLIKTVVSRNESEPGFLINAWNQMIEAIGRDYPDAP